MAIPRIIHQFWIDPSRQHRDVPEDIAANLLAWERTHPAYTRITWKPEALPEMLSEVNGVKVWDCIRKCRLPAMQSDIVRLALVYLHGGFYSDLKNLPLRPFLDDWASSEVAVLVEHPSIPSRPDPVGYICNAFFGAARGNDFLFACLAQACKSVSESEKGDVFSLTGPALFMKILARRDGAGRPWPYWGHGYKEVWNVRMKRTAASYNKDDQHWSIRQKSESLFHP